MNKSLSKHSKPFSDLKFKHIFLIDFLLTSCLVLVSLISAILKLKTDKTALLNVFTKFSEGFTWYDPMIIIIFCFLICIILFILLNFWMNSKYKKQIKYIFDFLSGFVISFIRLLGATFFWYGLILSYTIIKISLANNLTKLYEIFLPLYLILLGVSSIYLVAVFTTYKLNFYKDKNL